VIWVDDTGSIRQNQFQLSRMIAIAITRAEC
jgi:hypothetical protein